MITLWVFCKPARNRNKIQGIKAFCKLHDPAAQQGVLYNPLQLQCAHMHMLTPAKQTDIDLP